MAVGAGNATWGNGLAHGIALRSGNLVAAIRTDCADPTSSNSFPSNCTTNPDGSHAAWDPETGIVHPIVNRVLISSDWKSGRRDEFFIQNLTLDSIVELLLEILN